MAIPKIKKYGIYGRVGPAPRFTWAEVMGRGGVLPKDMRTRRRIVYIARSMNNYRAKVAKYYGVPTANVYISVNSWYRTAEYNRKIGGVGNSIHTVGGAIDARTVVKLRSGKAVLLRPQFAAQLATQVPMLNRGGIGWYGPRSGTFTHKDVRGSLNITPPGPARWQMP